ncbi:MAG: beta-barrel assembly-enhancing protease [Desulfovibrionaceae bacterium]
MGKIFYKKTLILCILFCFLFHNIPLYAFSIADEEKLGKQFSVFVKTYLPIIYDPTIAQYVENVVASIVSTLPPTPYTFTAFVINDPSVNAFATPGGYIFINTGLLLAMENEDQLAAVISHEIGHITNRHIASRIERSSKITLFSLLVGLAGLALGPPGIAILLGSLGASHNASLYFSRLDESEADKSGMQYLVRAGYNPYSLSESFAILRKNMLLSGSGTFPIYMSTHPEIADRVNHTKIQAETFSQEIQKRSPKMTSFKRVQNFVRAKYDIPKRAIALLHSDTACEKIFLNAIIHSRMQERSYAKEYFDKALLCSSNNALFYREAAIFYFDSNDIDTADTLLTQALFLNPKDSFSLFYLARVKEEKKENALSKQLYSSVLNFFPEDPEVHYYYGRILGKTGEEFSGYIHLAYSSLYLNNLEKTGLYRKQAETLIQSENQRNTFKIFDTLYQERVLFIKANMRK